MMLYLDQFFFLKVSPKFFANKTMCAVSMNDDENSSWIATRQDNPRFAWEINER